MNYRLFMALALLSILNISCSEEIAVPLPEISETIVNIYYLDGEAIAEEVVLDNYDNTHNVIEVKKAPITNQTIATYNSFSTVEKYIDWGERHGYDFKLRMETANHLQKYAEDHNVISQYEETQHLSQDYIDYEINYLKSKGLWKDSNERTFGQLYDFCVPSPVFPFATTVAVMPAGWNNRVSRISTIAVVSIMNIYDRSFYRKGITSVVLFAGVNYCLSEAPILNNKMSSVIMS